MAVYNPDFWEVPTATELLDRVPASRALWFETDTDRDRRAAVREFYARVAPAVNELVEAALTRRQREVLVLYYFHGKTQEDIAVILNLSQSTVSRHLFGTMRNGRKVGGAIRKLRKAIDREPPAPVTHALDELAGRLARAV